VTRVRGILLALPLVLAPACGGGDPGGAAGTITIADFGYGEPLTVTPGAVVAVVNQDAVEQMSMPRTGRVLTPTCSARAKR